MRTSSPELEKPGVACSGAHLGDQKSEASLRLLGETLSQYNGGKKGQGRSYLAYARPQVQTSVLEGKEKLEKREHGPQKGLSWSGLVPRSPLLHVTLVNSYLSPAASAPSPLPEAFLHLSADPAPLPPAPPPQQDSTWDKGQCFKGVAEQASCSSSPVSGGVVVLQQYQMS